MYKLFYLLFIPLFMSCAKENKEATTSSANTKVAETTQNQGISPLKQIEKSDAPKEIAYKGDVSAVYQFSDKEGEHVLVVAETGEKPSASKEGDERDTEMNVYHLLKKEGKYTEIWKAQDYVRNCPFDLILSIRPESMEVTDLDKDGIAEISFAYYITCISDVSPYDMKLLMYEGANKYALRGTAKLVEIPSKYTIDANFKTAPAEFLNFAKEKWTLWEDQAAG